ncbi:MAG TPA: ImmA/IrrE family metallo-endopeptidase [Candidatus Scybalomonas excrementigallinarum]|nr:ImmA/IrrE family metallo-endopeptidase [Candidatus Scybalomonas excrementigallinarum]
MISIDNQELFQKYYQKEYDFNTTSLTSKEVNKIKRFVKEKRVDYAIAPIGEKVFEWILEQDPNLKFELVDFESEKIDGMLYIPSSGSDKAYIILNSNKALINQIFTALHEYYHYIADYTEVKKKPYICNFSELTSVNEKRASRFAAEFLLPEDALKNEINFYARNVNMQVKDLSFEDYATICIFLTLKYRMPLKAVIYRLFEERYIKDVALYIEEYDFIKDVLQQLKIFEKQVEALYSSENIYLEVDNFIHKKMKTVYMAGYASREEIIRDAEKLNLDLDKVQEFFEDISNEDEDEDDLEVIDFIQKHWGNEE